MVDAIVGACGHLDKRVLAGLLLWVARAFEISGLSTFDVHFFNGLLNVKLHGLPTSKRSAAE